MAVKDLIDVAGVPTTAGCRAVARTAQPAVSDAACLRGARAAGARIVGKTNLHELAILPLGVNPWFGTPVNPLDAGLVPGGSSSGSAVAVATGEADVALGSDTGGSVRIPAACCGIAGLKTTHGRVPLEGVWPLAPSLDTIGPLATSVAGLELGMRLLEPGFTAADAPARTIGRVRTDSLPAIETAIDAALREAGFEVVDVEVPDWTAGTDLFTTIFFAEMWDVDHHLMQDPDGLGEDTKLALGLAGLFAPGVDAARARLVEWRAQLAALFVRVELLALPTMPIFAPRLEDLVEDNTALIIDMTRHTSLFNAAATPCVSLPVPVEGGALPASLQLVGPLRSEDLLLATAAVVERATAR